MYLGTGSRGLRALFRHYKLEESTPFRKLPEDFLDRVFNGPSKHHDDEIAFSVMNAFGKYIREGGTVFEKFTMKTQCSECESSGIKLEARNVFFRGTPIHHLSKMSVENLFDYFKSLTEKSKIIDEANDAIWKPIFSEITERLLLLKNIGLSYLTINRKANTLSGGEAQRLRLASQIGSGLEECLYVLDEPSIGLHSVDNERLIETLKLLRDKNNTLLVIEHDEDTMLSSDYFIEIGPLAGKQGGELLFSGRPRELKNLLTDKKIPSTLTLDYLIGKKIIDSSNLIQIDEKEQALIDDLKNRKKVSSDRQIAFKNLNKFNVSKLNLSLPRGKIIAIVGVSGSGKSTLLELIEETLRDAFEKQKRSASSESDRNASLQNKKTSNLEKNNSSKWLQSVKTKKKPEKKETRRGIEKDHLKKSLGQEKVKGIESLFGVISIDQKPIGRTSRSNIATYTKAWDDIRDLFAMMPLSKIRGYEKGRFSFNVIGGRCEECGGAGMITLDMKMFSSVDVLCESCNGKRFSDATLEVKIQGKNVYDVLEMTVAEASDFFSVYPKLSRIFKILKAIGLDYIKLGQSSSTISGGEAQRIKLARELARRPRGEVVYLLDEPTTGLHFEDIRKLLGDLRRLSLYGHTIIIVEHNLEVVKIADHVIEMGPVGGEKGGKVVYQGSPLMLSKAKTATGKVMKEYFAREKERKAGKFLEPKNFEKLMSESSKVEKPSYVSNDIVIKQLRTNNLKNISLSIPKGEIVVITGVSGSGKTSLLFDSIFVEGQRRYVESLSTYARRFIDQFPRVDADSIENLAPTICINQENFSKNPRSLIATYVELYDRFRLLYANISDCYCPICGKLLKGFSVGSVVKKIIKAHARKKVIIGFPLSYDLKTEKKDHWRFGNPKWISLGKSDSSVFEEVKNLGISRLLLDGTICKISDEKTEEIFDKSKNKIAILDRIDIDKQNSGRITEAIERAYKLSEGFAWIFEEIKGDASKKKLKDDFFFLKGNFQLIDHFSEMPFCLEHGYHVHEAVTTRDFSFNHRLGACDICEGTGIIRGFSLERLLVSPKKPIFQGAFGAEFSNLFLSSEQCKYFVEEANDIGWQPLKDEKPYSSISRKRQNLFFYGGRKWRGIYHFLYLLMTKRKYVEAKRRWVYQKILSHEVCGACSGTRLKRDLGHFRIDGMGIIEITRLSVKECHAFFSNLSKRLSLTKRKIVEDVIDDIVYRLTNMMELGLDYLSLDRPMHTLSGGERQRVRLSTQIGSKLSGVMYILDEPTVGLHERDTQNLFKVIRKLKELDNSVLMIEHCQSAMLLADYIVDMGPEAGENGGEVVYAGRNEKKKLKGTSFYPFVYGELQGKLFDIVNANDCRLTDPKDNEYATLSKTFYKKLKSFSFSRRNLSHYVRGDSQVIFKNIYKNNVKGESIALPVNKIIGLSGVSGSGKSSIMEWIVEHFLTIISDFEVQKKSEYAKVDEGDRGRTKPPFPFKTISVVDQSPVSTNSRSVISTYMGFFDDIRTVFSQTIYAKQQAMDKGFFSFNSKKGACSECAGLGEKQIEMHFVSDIVLPCEECKGKRFNPNILKVRWRGKTIADVLQMTISDAVDFFSSFIELTKKMEWLQHVGSGVSKTRHANKTSIERRKAAIKNRLSIII